MAVSKVSVLALGHAFKQGVRGEAGGAASKDSVWGIAQIGRELVTFSGRRGGALKFKAEGKTSLDVLLAVFKDKKAGLGCAVAYTDVTKKVAKVDETLEARLAAAYKDAKAAGKVTARKLQFELA